MSLLSDGEFAITEGVPELDGSIAGARYNLSVVCREGYGENVVVVADKASGGSTGRKLPQPKSLIPGSRQGISTI